jgi:hypothetical protein
VSLVKGSGGIYTVEVGGRVVARKTLDRGFPSEAEVVAAVLSATTS